MDSDASPPSLCLICAFHDYCPRELPVDARDAMIFCNYYIEHDFPKEKALIVKMNVKKSKPLPPVSSQTTELIQEVIHRQEMDTRGMLSTYCKACNLEMEKIMTPKHVFYRCPHYPDCDVNADPHLVSFAVFEDLATRQEYQDIVSIYEYSDDLNRVFVSFEKRPQ